MEIKDPIEVEKKIYMIRGKKVMLDSDLARLYGVSTKSLNLAVKRNPKRFPPDFMCLLSKQEVANLRFQFETSSLQVIENKRFTYGGRRYSPYAFTEQGIAMLSTVLNSERAIQVNIQIMRAFIRLRELIASNELLIRNFKCHSEGRRPEESKNEILRFAQDDMFEAIKKLIEPSPEESRPERRIGFHSKRTVGASLAGAR